MIDAASEYFLDALGAHGEHARAAIGVSSLPRGACIEIEVVVTTTGSAGAA